MFSSLVNLKLLILIMQYNNNGANHIFNEETGAKLFDSFQNYKCIFCASQIPGSSVVLHLKTHFSGINYENCKQSGNKYLRMAVEDTWLQSTGCEHLTRWCYYDPFCKYGFPWENPIPLSDVQMDQSQIDPCVKEEFIEPEQAPSSSSSNISVPPLPSLASPVPVSYVSTNYSSTPNNASHQQSGIKFTDLLQLVQNQADNIQCHGSTLSQHQKQALEETEEQRPSVPIPTRVVIIEDDDDEYLPESANTSPATPSSHEFGSPAPGTPNSSNSMSHDLSAMEKEQESRNRLEEAARQKREHLDKTGQPPPKPPKLMVGRDECRDPNNECGNQFVPSVAHFAHVNSVHLKLPLYKCKARGCRKEFTGTNTGGIHTHIKSQHGKEQLKEREQYIHVIHANHRIVQQSIKTFFPFSTAAEIEDSR